jgi:hypothetical protein
LQLAIGRDFNAEAVALQKYRKSDKLDAYLKFLIGGKYRWRRRKPFERFAVEHLGHSGRSLKALIARLSALGPSNDEYERWSFDDFPQWQSKFDKSRAVNAAKERWKCRNKIP